MVPYSRQAVQCACCGTEVFKQLAQVQRNKTGRFFCSLKCMHIVGSKPRTLPDLICKLCGDSFRPVSRRSTAEFCSKACYDEHQRRNRVFLTCCSCGTEFPRKRGEQRKQDEVFCSRKCRDQGRVVNGLGRLHNGREVTRNRQGYALIHRPDHPNSFSNGRMLEHRWVAEQKLGRLLLRSEQVHHLNGIKLDNRPENLAVLSPSEHTMITLDESGQRREAAQQRIRDLEAEVARLSALVGDTT